MRERERERRTGRHKQKPQPNLFSQKKETKAKNGK